MKINAASGLSHFFPNKAHMWLYPLSALTADLECRPIDICARETGITKCLFSRGECRVLRIGDAARVGKWKCRSSVLNDRILSWWRTVDLWRAVVLQYPLQCGCQSVRIRRDGGQRLGQDSDRTSCREPCAVVSGQATRQRIRQRGAWWAITASVTTTTTTKLNASVYSTPAAAQCTHTRLQCIITSHVLVVRRCFSSSLSSR